MPERRSSTPNGRGAAASTYIVTNTTKAVGLYVILKEQAGQGRDTVVIAGVLLALGAHTAERILLALIDRFFGGGGGSK